jgi:hypothetical protein
MNSTDLVGVHPRIFTIRNKRVMLDGHLAEFYGVKPIRLREQVRRNIERFPADFMFQLTAAESHDLVSQKAIPSRRSLGGHRPLVFTQEGIAMLTSVLRSPRAIRANIAIMRAFVQLKASEHWRGATLRKLGELERKFSGHDQDIARLFETLRELMEPAQSTHGKIGFQP